jgi:Mce-associated membrane protein
VTALVGRGVRVAMAVLCVPVIASGAVLAARSPEGGGAGSLTSTAADQATAAATSAVQRILSYDYRSIPADIAAAKADTTGLFRQQYALRAPQILAEAPKLKAIVQAKVLSSGVVSSSAHDVVVLLFVDQATVREPPGQTSPTTRLDQSRVQVTMTRVGDRWLVSFLHAL